MIRRRAGRTPEGSEPERAPSSAGRRRLLLGAGALGTLAAGCGGGTDIAGVGTGGTGHVAGVGTGGTGQVATYTSGPISGFGSVIVNGVKFDDDAAQVIDDLGAALKLSTLGLGMVVEIEGTADTVTGLGTARSIRVISLLAGQVVSIDAATGRFTVMSMTVTHDTATVWNMDDGPTILKVGDRVEIWGFLDSAAGVLRASRVEIAATRDATAVAKVRGTVTAYDPTNRWLAVDGQFVDVRDVVLPVGLAVGATVAAAGAQLSSGNAPLRASQLAIQTPPPAQADAEVVSLENVISGWSSLSRFKLLDTWVDASGASIVGGTAGMLRNGVRVRAIGERSGSLVRVRTLEVRTLATAPTSTSTNGGETASNGSPGSSGSNGSGGNGSSGTGSSAGNGASSGNGSSSGNGASSGSEASPGNSGSTGSSGSVSTSSAPNTRYDVDGIQVVGTVVAAPKANRFSIVDGAMRRFSVSLKDADIVNGRRSDIDRGTIVRVSGTQGSPIVATRIRIIARAPD